MPKRTRKQEDVEAQARKIAEAFEAAVNRSRELGLVDYVLCRARDDREWREGVEKRLSKRSPLGELLHGAKPSAAWDPKSPLHRRLANRIQDNPMALGDFGMANPRVREEVEDQSNTLASVREKLPLWDALLATWLLFPEDFAAKLAILEEACDELEALRAAGKAECDQASTPDAESSGSPAESGADSAHAARIAELEKALHDATSAAASQTQQHERELKELRKQLRTRTSEVSRKDSKQQELRDRAKAAEVALEEAQRETRLFRTERDEAKRQVAKLESQVKADRQGREKVEGKLEAETGRYLATIGDLRDQVQTAKDVSAAMEARVASLETELAGERTRRAELEQAFEAFGFEDMVKSAMSFAEAVDSLIRIRDAVSAYAKRQAEREHEREEAERATKEERERATRMLEAQKQAEAAWKEREHARLSELENALFPDGELDHVFIDGHNLVHRIFRPEDEARTRPWLEELTVEMAKRLEETKGWGSVYHLVFDTKAWSNMRPEGYGVRVYFANSTTEGGADARIAELLREQLPTSHCMVVSTDRRHVWADADRLIAEEGRTIELVQVEMLAEYLQVMDGLRKRR